MVIIPPLFISRRQGPQERPGDVAYLFLVSVEPCGGSSEPTEKLECIHVLVCSLLGIRFYAITHFLSSVFTITMSIVEGVR